MLNNQLQNGVEAVRQTLFLSPKKGFSVDVLSRKLKYSESKIRMFSIMLVDKKEARIDGKNIFGINENIALRRTLKGI